ncbi:hypothetical protein K502DRAFT_365176 [Neoconidiobolus thromboides FSU 785]|nr:hypothetical protein K502DRAFT_365176 [Neoconidiobolus thromboides FSU 785]
MRPISFAEEGKLGRSSVPHLMQEHNWDCGLACVGMVLRALGGYTVTLPELANEVASENVWTIDLCYLLAHHASWCDFTYYTTFLGANPDHLNDEPFYKNTSATELARVNQMFNLANRYNISILRMLFPIEDYKRFLVHRKFAIIALVNAELLKCSHCEQQKDTGRWGWVQEMFCFTPCKMNIKLRRREYVGHFIVLIGYEPETDSFIYRDPAASAHFCMISAEDFDLSRQSNGTDNDCIVIKL